MTQTTDAALVERLRAVSRQMREHNPGRGGFNPVMPHEHTLDQAADTIEAQARRIEALEGAGQSLLDRAIMLATRCHEGQVDKGGQPYILHPLRVMLACQTEQERITAVLHDVMEDCGVSWATIARRFGDAIADAVAALTREEGESYASFIKRCATNPIARTVKMADLADNMDVRRLGREPTAEDGKRLHRYADARALLSKAPTP